MTPLYVSMCPLTPFSMSSVYNMDIWIMYADISGSQNVPPVPRVDQWAGFTLWAEVPVPQLYLALHLTTLVEYLALIVRFPV